MRVISNITQSIWRLELLAKFCNDMRYDKTYPHSTPTQKTRKKEENKKSLMGFEFTGLILAQPNLNGLWTFNTSIDFGRY